MISFSSERGIKLLKLGIEGIRQFAGFKLVTIWPKGESGRTSSAHNPEFQSPTNNASSNGAIAAGRTTDIIGLVSRKTTIDQRRCLKITTVNASPNLCQ
jgi:hypothetical protein